MTNQNSPQNHYELLRVKPTASPQDIRRAYRDLSKLYHPDTTQLAPHVATEKFQILNEAYATLSNPEKRLAYDYSIGFSRVAVIQAPAYLNRPASERSRYQKSSAYLEPTDRPLSAGEIFALFILGVTFVGCLALVFAISWTKGTIIVRPAQTEEMTASEVFDVPVQGHGSDVLQQSWLSPEKSPELPAAELPAPAPKIDSMLLKEDISTDVLPLAGPSSKMNYISYS